MTALKARGNNWRTIFALIGSAFGILFFLVQAFSLGVLWLTSFLTSQTDLTQTISTGLLAWASILSGLMLLPVFLYSFYSLKARPIPRWLVVQGHNFRKISRGIILLWPLVVFVGWRLAGSPRAAAFLLGPVNVLVAGLPVLWVYQAAQEKLEGGSPLRKWGIFGFSLTVMPAIVMVLELIAMLILAAFFGLWLTYQISINPELEEILMGFVNQLSADPGDLERVIESLESVLLQPAVVFWGLAIIGGIMPIIEEVIKPLTLWFMAGRRLTPQEGFVGGVLCGAGFALMENVLYFTTVFVPEDWLFLALGRAGTGVLHMLTSGVVGWGLAKAWRDGKWLFSALTLFAAIILHAVWNVLALVTGLAPQFLLDADPTLGQTLLYNAPMVLLLLISALAMILINRHLRKNADLIPEIGVN